MRTRMLRGGLPSGLVLAVAPLVLAGCRGGADRCAGGSCSHPTPTSAVSPAVQPGMQASAVSGRTLPESGYAGSANRPAEAATGTSYAGQKTCPVSGAVLGASGPPVAVAVRGQTIYVCCENCAAKVRANPDLYLPRVAAERGASAGGAPAASPPAPAATSALYGGQRTCPVTGETLDPDGSAIPVTVRGQTIYVCCSGCAAKVKRAPDAYLAKVATERGTVSR